MDRFVVVGAGLLGASVAYRLAEAGARVTIVEAGRPGAGTSGRTFGWLNAQDKAPDDYFDLNLQGLRAYEGLRRDLGADPWYHGGGDLAVGWGEWATKVRERAGAHRAAGYRVEEPGRAGIAELEPALILPGDAEEVAVAWYPDEGWIDGPVLVAALLTAGARFGLEVLVGDPVASLESTGGGATAILASGRRLEADRIVVAAGSASGALVGTAGWTLPMAPSPGLLAITEPVAVDVRRVVHVAGSMSLRPDGGGRLMLAARGVDAGLAPGTATIAVDGPECAALLARAATILPIGDARIEAARVGIRSVPGDRLPALGPVPGAEGLYLAVTHSGATLAALLGRLVARELLDGDGGRLGPYRPSRFAPG